MPIAAIASRASIATRALISCGGTTKTESPWTSLGLSLIEAMMLELPVVAVASTEVVEAVPPTAGVISTDLERLRTAARMYAADPEAARLAGKSAREYALARYGVRVSGATGTSYLLRVLRDNEAHHTEHRPHRSSSRRYQSRRYQRPSAVSTPSESADATASAASSTNTRSPHNRIGFSHPQDPPLHADRYVRTLDRTR
jgi:hypothetical protein